MNCSKISGTQKTEAVAVGNLHKKYGRKQKPSHVARTLVSFCTEKTWIIIKSKSLFNTSNISNMTYRTLKREHEHRTEPSARSTSLLIGNYRRRRPSKSSHWPRRSRGAGGRVINKRLESDRAPALPSVSRLASRMRILESSARSDSNCSSYCEASRGTAVSVVRSRTDY